MTVPEKTDHFVIISDFETLVPRCSVQFALYNGAVRFAIAYTVRESKYEHPRNKFEQKTAVKGEIYTYNAFRILCLFT